MNDDPFSLGNKTIIRPNPGGRRSTPPPGQKRPAPTPMPDAERTVIADMPQRSPPGQRIAPSSPTPPRYPGGEDADWMRQSPNQDAFFPQKKKPEPQAKRHTIPLEVALNARASGQINSDNPLMAYAAPLLILLGRLRQSVVEMQALPLMEHVAEEIRSFEAKALEAGEDRHDVQVAKYALCGTADDIVQNLPGTDRHVWMQFSMLAQFFGVRTSGVGFFDELKKVLANPGARYNLLELMHACLCLGFEGQYRGGGRGQADLHRIRHEAYEALRRVQARPDDDISPHWRGLGVAMRSFRSAVPTWVIASLAALFLVATFFVLRLLLTNDGEALADTLVALHPTSQIALERNSVLPVPEPADPPPTGQLERMRSALAEEIAAGGVDVEPVGNNIMVRVSNVLLFPSGSATVTPDFKAVADKIAGALNPEPGPIYINGHTDNVKLNPTSRFKSNYELSVARAESVENIVSLQISDPTRIEVDGKGADQPVADNATAEGRSLNRRVEILIPKEETLEDLIPGEGQ
ncbi:type VI secretion system protein TssL, long form [Fulvimarina sp. MAC3]|uniref:type VI secretion system protein TssL, long form n=1 Tax=Fulvimarina sp. MAC3 TaxID=3148887 RepID=UPI0031FCDFD2